LCDRVREGGGFVESLGAGEAVVVVAPRTRNIRMTLCALE
jgi:hypothetical protein